MKKVLLSLLAIASLAGSAWAGTGTKEDPYTVDDLLDNTYTTTSNVWVQGYIVGSATGSGWSSFTTNTIGASQSNIGLASSSAEDDYNFIIPVQLLNNTDTRNALQLSSHPENIRHQVKICGNIEAYFSVTGLKSASAYEWIGAAPDPSEAPEVPDFPTTVMTVAQALDLLGQGATGEGTVKGYISSIEEIETSQYGNAKFYMVDNLSSTANSLYVYGCKYIGGEDFTSADQIKVGGEVTVKGELVIYQGKKEFTNPCEIVEYTAPSGDVTPPTPSTEAMTVAEAIAWLNDGNKGNATAKGYITSIKEVDTGQYGNATYYIADETTGTTTITVYRGYYLNGAKFTSQDQIKVGDFVVVEGNLELYGNYKEPEFTSGNKILSINGETSGGNTGGGDNPGTTPGTPEGESVTFNFADPSSLGAGFSNDAPEGNKIDLVGTVLTNGLVTLSFEAPNGGNNLPRLWYNKNSGWDFRFYNNTDFVVTVSGEMYLKGIEFKGKNIGTNWTYSNGSLSGTTWMPAGDINTVTIGKNEDGNNPNVTSMTVYYSAESGVEAIGADNAEAVYYNLQGVRVANPDHGIFVKVQGGKTSKVLVK